VCYLWGGGLAGRQFKAPLKKDKALDSDEVIFLPSFLAAIFFTFAASNEI
jgi:hypothetical protein